jgi:hypothetical protein
MARAAQNAAWCRTFAVLAQIFNANRDRDKTQPLDPLEFYAWGDNDENKGSQDEVKVQKNRREMRTLFGKKA